MRAALPVAAGALMLIAAYGWWAGRPMPAATFWVTLALYPAWGIAQQFALQVLVTRPARYVVPDARWRIPAVAAVFSAAHYPNTELAALTLIAGVVFTALYENYGNLWAVGVLHGLLGATAYHVVLGDDPGRAILNVLHLSS
jgi:hypothetical protein